MKLSHPEHRLTGISESLAPLFDFNAEGASRFLAPVSIVALYLLGIYFWGTFFDWGRFPMNFGDWGSVTAPLLDAVRDGLHYHQLPLHVKNTQGLYGVPDRFLADAEAITTPQMLLLNFVDVDKFVAIDVLLSFTLSTVGLLWLRRHFGLSLLAYGILYTLFNFNGYIQAHYAVGNFTWAGYFCLPIFSALCVTFLEGHPGWRWVTLMAMSLSYLVLAGSEHFFVWNLIFLTALALTNLRKSKWILAAIVFACLLGAVRLVPAAMQSLSRPHFGPVETIPGYPSVSDSIYAMAVLKTPTLEWWRGLWGYWEYDLYLGFLGTVFLLIFGVFNGISSGRDLPFSINRLIMPAFLVALLAFGNTYAIFRAIPIPLLQGERVLSRIISVPLFVFLLAGSLRFQAWLGERTVASRLLLLIGSVLLANDLWLHSRFWNIPEMAKVFGRIHLDLSGNSLANRPDPPYFLSLQIGAVATILAVFFLLLLSIREYRRRTTPTSM